MKNKITFQFREVSETLVPNRSERISYMVALVFVLLMVVLTSVLWSRFPVVIPLYFSLPWGEARLANRFMLYLLPLLSLSILMTNLALGRLLVKLSPLLPRVLAIGAAVIALMLVIALFGIILSLLL